MNPPTHLFIKTYLKKCEGLLVHFSKVNANILANDNILAKLIGGF